MKTNDKQIKLLLLAVIALIVFAAYRFGYQPYSQKAEALKTEAKDYTAKISILNGKILRRATYEEGIATSADKAFEILEKYGGGNTTEKTIMTIHQLEQETGMQIANVAFGPENALYYTNKLKTYSDLGVYMYKQPITISYSVDYDGYKKAMDFINNNAERMNVESISANFDTFSGNLSGNMVINLYSVFGGKNIYTEPVIENMEFGVDGIFGGGSAPSVNPSNPSGEGVDDK